MPSTHRLHRLHAYLGGGRLRSGRSPRALVRPGDATDAADATDATATTATADAAANAGAAANANRPLRRCGGT